MRNVSRTGYLRMVGVVVLMRLALTLAFALPCPSTRQNSAIRPAASQHALRAASIAMQTQGDDSPWIKLWVQVMRDGEALGGPTKIELPAPCDVDDLCKKVLANVPYLTGIYAAELNVSEEGAPLDPSKQRSRGAPLQDVINNTCDSPLYIHAPRTESAADGLASADEEGRSQLSENRQLRQRIEELAGSPGQPRKLRNPEDFWLSSKNWADALEGRASPANLMQISNTLFAPSKERMTPIIDLFKQKACRVGVVLGPARCGKSEFLLCRLPKLVASGDLGEKQIVRLFANQDVSDEYNCLRGGARVDKLINIAMSKVPELSNQNQLPEGLDRTSSASSCSDAFFEQMPFEQRAIKVQSFLNELGVILIVDELYRFCEGLDTAGLQDFCTALFSKFDNGAPSNPSYLIFADTSGFSVPLMLAAQKVGGNIVRSNPASLFHLDQAPFGSGDAVHDSKILVAAFLKKSGCPGEVINQVRGLSTPYVGREFMLASSFATHAKSHGWTQQTWQERLRYRIEYDLKYYAEDIRRVYATLLDAENGPSILKLPFSDWLRYVRAVQTPDISGENKGYVASRRRLLPVEFHAFCLDEGRVLPAPGMEISLAQVLNLFLGPDCLGTSLENAEERETHESAVLTFDRAKSTAAFALTCNYQAEISACHSLYKRTPVSEERRLQQVRNLADDLLPMSAACAQMVNVVFNRQPLDSIYEQFEDEMDWPAEGGPQDLACRDWLRFFERHPQQIVYMVRVAQSHQETQSLGPLSQLYFTEKLAFASAKAAGEEYPNTDTLAFFDVAAPQEDESEVQNVQRFQADVATHLCAPYETTEQVGLRSAQGGVARAQPPPTAAASPELHPEEMPAILGSWGCDAELWSQIKNKEKLREYANRGWDRNARKFLEQVRTSIARREAAAAARARPPPTGAGS